MTDWEPLGGPSKCCVCLSEGAAVAAVTPGPLGKHWPRICPLCFDCVRAAARALERHEAKRQTTKPKRVKR